MIVSYPAVLYRDESEDKYTVAFHDLDLFTEGETVEEAFLRAKEFLQTYITYAKKFNEDLCEPTPFDTIKAGNKNIVFLVDAEVK